MRRRNDSRIHFRPLSRTPTLHYAILVCGAVGLCLGILGAFGLLTRRLSDPGLRDFSSPADYFNLVFFIVAFGSALLSFILVDSDFSRATAFCAGLVTFNLSPLSSASGVETYLPMAAAMLLSLLVAYIPLTHMSHFVGKNRNELIHRMSLYEGVKQHDSPESSKPCEVGIGFGRAFGGIHFEYTFHLEILRSGIVFNGGLQFFV